MIGDRNLNDVNEGTISPSSQVISNSGASFSWFIRLSDQGKAKTYAILGLALVVAGVGWVVFHSPILALFGATAILGSTAEYWLGVSYRLTETSASSKCGFSSTVIEWKNLKRIIVVGNSVRLSPLEKPSQMEVFRGVLLRTTPANHAQVLTWVQQFGSHDV